MHFALFLELVELSNIKSAIRMSSFMPKYYHGRQKNTPADKTIKIV